MTEDFTKVTEEFTKVSNHIEDCIQTLATDTLNASKLFTLTIQTIEYLENEYQNLNGQQKKELLIEAFHDLCDSTKHESLTLDTKMTIKNFINEDLETVIDSVIQLSKGEFKINEQQQKLFIRLALKACQCFMKRNDIDKERP